MAVVRQSQIPPPRRRPLPGGAGQPKFNQLEMEIQFGEDRCTQIRVIVVTDTARLPARPPQTHKHTDRTDYNTLRR